MEPSSWTASPRWRSNLTADHLTAQSRRTSGNSSTSSDILVASVAPGVPVQQHQPTQGRQQQAVPTTSMADRRTSAIVQHGSVLRVEFGSHASRQRLGAIVRSTPKPQIRFSNSTSAHRQSEDEDPDEVDDESEENAGSPDPSKTYSKVCLTKRRRVGLLLIILVCI